MVSDIWRNRGYLPHREEPGLVHLITIRLVDSIPSQVIDRLGEEVRRLPEGVQQKYRQRRVEQLLDAGLGDCHLGDPEIARIVRESMAITHNKMCRVVAWVIMPNHVHVLIRPIEAIALGDIVRAWKGPSARKANLLLDASGKFWSREYHDRYMRGDRHFDATVRYIHENPVKARLCNESSDFEFSSARAYSRWESG